MDSNIILSMSILFKLFLLFPVITTLTGCDPNRVSHHTESNSSYRWIESAVEIAEKIPVDLHRVEHDRSLSKIATAAIDVGITDQSERILSSIDSWRKAELLARLAVKQYSMGRELEGDKLIEESQEFLRKNKCEDWQASRVNLVIEQAGLLKGESVNSHVVSKMEPSDQADLMPSLIDSSVNVSNIVEKLNQLNTTTNKVNDMDSSIGVVNAFIALYAKSQELENEQINQLRNRILESIEITFKGVPAIIAAEKLVDLMNRALDAGDEEFAKMLSEKIKSRLEPVRADMRYQVQLKYALVLAEAEMFEEAKEQVCEVKAGVGDKNILHSERPRLLAKAGSIFLKCNEKESADSCFSLALKELESITNARPRAVSAVDICLTMAQAKLEDDALLSQMKSLSANLSDPW